MSQTDEQTGGRRARALRTGRLEAFSDGVFAIAITLLVLEIKAPEAAGSRLGHDLIELWPSYVAYVTSFLTIGAIWLAHVAITEQLAGADPILLRLNLPLLMVVSFLPFPSKLLGESISHTEEAHLVAPFYGATLLVLGLLTSMIWAYARRSGMLRPGLEEDAHHLTRQLRVALIFYAVAIGVAVVVPRLGVVCYLLIALFVMLPSVAAYRAARTSAAT